MKKLALFASVLMLGVLTAGAGTLGVAQFNDGGGQTNTELFPPTLQASWIALKNNTGSTATYTILYYGLDGSNRTPAANTFTVAANSTVGWRPVATDTNEIPGIPNATAGSGAGSASILYSGTSTDVSGRVAVFVGGTNPNTYAFALIP